MGHKYTKILPQGEDTTFALYLGSIDYVLEDQILSELGIQCIVSVLPHAPALMGEIMEKHEIDRQDFFLKPLEDNRSEYISLFDPPTIIAVVDFIHERRKQGKVVLVHCDAGNTINYIWCIFYYMTINGRYSSQAIQSKFYEINKQAE